MNRVEALLLDLYSSLIDLLVLMSDYNFSRKSMIILYRHPHSFCVLDPEKEEHLGIGTIPHCHSPTPFHTREDVLNLPRYFWEMTPAAMPCEATLRQKKG